jgi:hypothetical protein
VNKRVACPTLLQPATTTLTESACHFPLPLNKIEGSNHAMQAATVLNSLSTAATSYHYCRN